MSEPKRRRSGGRRRSGPKPGNSSAASHEKVAELQPVDTPPDIQRFTEWDLGDDVQNSIAQMDIVSPTPIQALAIGPVLEGRDVIAKAETGTGKTLAFGAPMIAKIEAERSSILGLVLCPTRELAQQVANVLQALALPRGIKVALLVGGDPIQPQVRALQAGAQVVVATPGRVLDLMGQRFLTFPWTEFVVLDEADEMLEIGFLDDVEKILLATPEERQTLLFSATFPPALLKLARKHTKDPVELATAKGVATVENIEQVHVQLSEDERLRFLEHLIRTSADDDLLLVFGDRRIEVDRMMRKLERLPQGVKALHGGYDQAARFRVMDAFRGGQVRALIATDVASRGLDVTGVTHVVNYGVPRDVSSYTHRIGRTGRAGRSGAAITFVTPENRRRWAAISSDMSWDVPELEPREVVSRFFDGAPARRNGRRDGEERPRRKRRDDAAGGEERRERGPRRDREEREPRGEREPRRDREARRPRRERDDDRKREEPPRREREAPAADAGGFGAGVLEPGRPRRKEQPPRERERKKREPREREPRSVSQERSSGDADTGFGAGL